MVIAHTQRTSSQWHFQHLISMSLSTSTSTSSDLNDIINIISSQWNYQQQKHHHINIIINNNIISYQLLSILSLITTSCFINIIININVTSYQLISLIKISSINHIPHIHTYIVHAWDSHSRGLQTTQV